MREEPVINLLKLFIFKTIYFIRCFNSDGLNDILDSFWPYIEIRTNINCHFMLC